MSMTKDVLIDFLVELLKEEREQRRKETEENAIKIKELLFRLVKLETELILERHTPKHVSTCRPHFVRWCWGRSRRLKRNYDG